MGTYYVDVKTNSTKTYIVEAESEEMAERDWTNGLEIDEKIWSVESESAGEVSQ